MTSYHLRVYYQSIKDGKKSRKLIEKIDYQNKKNCDFRVKTRKKAGFICIVNGEEV